MSEFLKQDRDFVVPGDLIIKSIDYLPGKNAFRDGDGIYAKKLGLVSIANRVISVIPLNCIYLPKVGDMVIAEVKEIQGNGWILEMNSPYEAFLPLSGVRKYIDTNRTKLSSVYDIGDRLFAKISVVNQLDTIHASMYDMETKKLNGGRIVTMNPAKVPRLIGRAGSMVSTIKRLTGCNIAIGHNGVVWIDGGDMEKALAAVRLVEKEAYTSGLTDRVTDMLGGQREPMKEENAVEMEKEESVEVEDEEN